MIVVSVATGTPAASVTMNADGDSQGGNCWVGCVISQSIEKVFKWLYRSYI